MTTSSFDYERDITPVATVICSPYVLEVFPGFPAATVPELIDQGANPMRSGARSDDDDRGPVGSMALRPPRCHAPSTTSFLSLPRTAHPGEPRHMPQARVGVPQ